jgi:hypothetical protein
MSLAISVGQRDHIRGFATGPVALVEYGDYDASAAEQRINNPARYVHRRLEHGDHIIEQAASCLLLMLDPVREIRGAPCCLFVRSLRVRRA